MGRCLKLQGVPVDGYLHWTISDNWEWADGYCPKFGLVDVDRSHNLTRRPRPSYFLYQQVRLKLTLFLKSLQFLLPSSGMLNLQNYYVGDHVGILVATYLA
jgi:hypothetical protein